MFTLLGSLTPAEEPAPAPASLSLAAAGPNPFRAETALVLTLPEAQHVSVVLYDVLGRRVAVLHAGVLAAGAHRVAVNGAALAPGGYVARAVAGVSAVSRTLTRLR